MTGAVSSSAAASSCWTDTTSCGRWQASSACVSLTWRMSYYEREPRGGAVTTHQEMARCAEVVSGAAARARPGASLAEVLSSWRGSPAALAAYVSRIEVTHGVAGGALAAVAVDRRHRRIRAAAVLAGGRW